MREHRNFVEFVSSSMTMLAVLERNGASAVLLDALGTGRIVTRRAT